ncbi:11167_t:CDS:2 [Acaulospora morrowiae]|uniref:11167_t:CDS:1 n=1 Tax=Acaulospora morrowiae TaxID=94023 RepID=A0A9N8WC34_9GLOM|nr:11167_t:CDS:2 [Acaulospora morrowiae]
MFRRKPNLPAPPSPLSFNDILSDLTHLQAYNQQPIGEKIDILEIINSDSNGETKNSEAVQMPTFSPTSLIEHLPNLSVSSSSSIPQETLDTTYNLCTNYINVNNQLLVSHRDLDGLGLEIEGLRKELSGMVETLERSEVIDCEDMQDGKDENE